MKNVVDLRQFQACPNCKGAGNWGPPGYVSCSVCEGTGNRVLVSSRDRPDEPSPFTAPREGEGRDV